MSKKKNISFYSFLLFVIPVVTLIVCFQIIAYYYAEYHTIPFIDGKASVSQIGRGEKTIVTFKSGFSLYIIISVFFYFQISNFLFLNGYKNRLKVYGVLANIFLFVYIISLGREGSFYEISRRLAITLYIANIYINHFYLIKNLRLLKFTNKIEFNGIYLVIFYIIIILMTLLAIIGLPWVNPLFEYPNQLKNIIEWNFFLLTIIFYIPLSLMFYQLDRKI